MTTTDRTTGADRFRLLATYVAGRPVHVEVGRDGEPAHTDGRTVFVSATADDAHRRREVLCQAALLGGGSLAPDVVRSLRGRPRTARRYLAIEGARALRAMAGTVAIPIGDIPAAVSRSPGESLALSRGRGPVAAAPDWFGALLPSRLVTPSDPGSGGPLDEEVLRLLDDLTPEAEGRPGRFARLLRRSGERDPSGGAGAGRGSTTSARWVDRPPDRSVAGAPSLPLTVPDGERADPLAAGAGGVRYPEWDERRQAYRPAWCRVTEEAVPESAGLRESAVEHDEVLRRRLARVGLGPTVLRRRPDGDDLDLDAVVERAVDLAAGTSPSDAVHLERRRLARDLGVLILLDASGSANELDPTGSSVHERQRQAAATLAVTLEELGDRVAVYGFRSHGRSAVRVLPLKPFDQRFGAGGRARLNQLAPSGYTRIGAAVRHAGAVLEATAGTPSRLLVVLSDGLPFDHGYEGPDAEADVRRSLDELRARGTACLCLSIGSSTPDDAHHRTFGAATHAAAPTLAELSPRMDELFLDALRELAVGQTRWS